MFLAVRVIQHHSIQKLHGDERLPVLLANVVNRADVGVVQSGRCFRLASEAAQSLINRKIKNKICGADDLEGLGSAVTGSADAYIFRPPVPSRDPMELKLPHPDAVWDFAR
jgi:hypothetical protein